MAAQISSANRWYIASVLALVYALNIADRYVVSTVLEPIRHEFHLSDSSVAFLTGVSLALFYVTIGIPVATFADRSNRRNIVAAAMVAWSIMTACCGLATTFVQFMLARIGVGIGETGGTPPSSSIIADYFPPVRRPAAMTVFALGAPLGAWLGSTVAGKIAELNGWRTAFFALGVPGIVLGILVLTTIREPQRAQPDTVESARATPVSLRDAMQFLRTQRSALHIMIAGAVMALWGWGLMWWTPAFLQRAYHLSVGQAGDILGPMHLYGGGIATLLTGWITTLPWLQSARRLVMFMAAVVGFATIPSFLAYYMHSLAIATAMLWLFVPALYIYIGPTIALLLNFVPPAVRAQTIAISLLLANVANLVIAPQVIGAVSDGLKVPLHSEAESLRYALLGLALTGFWAAFHYLWSMRTFIADARRVNAVASADAILV